MTREPTEMEERVARAIDERIEGWFGDRNEANLNTVDLARAAIKVMREPTTAMVRAGGTGAVCTAEEMAFMWQTMIDEASPEEQ